MRAMLLLIALVFGLSTAPRAQADPPRVVGYKAGLTSPAAQARFGTDRPLLGELRDGMLLEDGAVVDPAGAPQVRWEADLLLVVGADAINQATTREQVLAALAGYHPFIEVPTLGPDTGRPPSAARLAEINVGAWRGVVGPLRRLPPDAITSLAAMRVRAFDASGALLAEGKGSDVLGHPLDVVLWVRDAVKAKGGRLRPGDVISVGAFTPLTPPKPGQTVVVRYEGLPGDPEVRVSFR